MKKWIYVSLLILTIGVLGACGNSGASSEDKKELVIGATSGPYSDMVTKAIKPLMEEKGYTIEVKEFSDYIQPNIALSQGDLDANLFQHKIYMETFAKEHNIDLSQVIIVPTAPMGIYSKKFSSIEEIKEGSQIAIPNDPTNAARAFQILEDAKLITLNPEANPLTVSEKDIQDNKLNLQFEPIEAAQLPRAVESVDLSAVPGNYALAAGMDLLKAIQLEDMPDDYRNRVVVDTKNEDSTFAKELKAVVESKEFEKVIDDEFKGFGKPKWMKEK
ncbi:MetQ/NlpA family ABC transporter substrate-binding protein [Rossellomorea sp. BNER]|uniref:MetQ/NlpA family ABC transporter substrate-binding protein n=1 Tax=Rossellomorea sp. BNER TaxID=2962031 RepID=UPI003AF27458|nr:MetQ/NlpA family ABC transporter substrate-binding protein [Rossellomorea sp. BNER]